MTTPNALLGPIKMDAAGNLYVSADGGATWTLQQLPPSDIPLATPSAAGLMSAAQFSSLDGFVSAVSPSLDFTTAASGISFATPLTRAGYLFVATNTYIVSKTARVTAATGSLTLSCGNDAGNTNVVATCSATSGVINSLGAVALTPVVGYASGVVGAGPGAGGIDGATEIKIKVVPAAGVTVFTGWFVVQGTWIKIAS